MSFLWEESLPGSLNFRLRLRFRWVHSIYCLHVNIGRQRLLSTSGRTCHGVLFGWTCWCLFYWWKEHNIVSYCIISINFPHSYTYCLRCYVYTAYTEDDSLYCLKWPHLKCMLLFSKIWEVIPAIWPWNDFFVFRFIFLSRKKVEPDETRWIFHLRMHPPPEMNRKLNTKKHPTNKTTK